MSELTDLIKSSPPGKTILYHTGFVSYDRKGRPALSLKVETLEQVVNAVANEAYEAYLDGLCALVQRKIGHDKYNYFAIVLSPDPTRKVRNRSLHDSNRRPEYEPEQYKPQSRKGQNHERPTPHEIFGSGNGKQSATHIGI